MKTEVKWTRIFLAMVFSKSEFVWGTTVETPPPSSIVTTHADGSTTQYTRDENGNIIGTRRPASPSGGGSGSSSSLQRSPSPSVKDEASKNQSLNALATAVSGVSAVMTAQAGAASLPKNPPAAAMYFAMMAMSIAQMAASASTSRAAGRTKSQVEGYGEGGLSGVDSSVLSPQEEAYLRNTMNELGSPRGIQGIRMDNTGNIIMPDGTKLKMADMVNPKTSLGKSFASAMKKAELETLSKAEKEALSRLEKKGALNPMALSEDSTLSGGGAAAAALSSSSSSMEGSTFNGSASSSMHLARIPASSLDGMRKNFNGEAIGVGADDIFKMIQRRYERKVDQKSFLFSE